MQAEGLTYQGQRENNEDFFLLELDRKIFAVADGMGGHKAGEVASALAVKKVKDYLRSLGAAPDFMAELERAVQEANREVFQQSFSLEEREGMGTTLTVVWVVETTAFVAHVGDSRVYLLRENGIRMVTSDHSLVYEMVQNGSLSEDEARSHPHRNVLTRAVGINEEVIVDTLEFPLQAGDLLLLCTDGLSGALSEEEIQDVLVNRGTLDEACVKLVEEASRNGAEDNITCVLVQID